MTTATGTKNGQSIMDFSHDFGIPSHLTFDSPMAQVGRNTAFMDNIRKLDIRYHISGP